MAKIELKFDDQVRAIVFPPTMTVMVKSWLQERMSLAALELKVGSAKTLKDALTSFNAAAAQSLSAINTANSLRAALGLPPTPVYHN